MPETPRVRVLTERGEPMIGVGEGSTRRDIDPLHRTVTVSIQRQENAHGQPLVGAPKTDAGKRTIVLPGALAGFKPTSAKLADAGYKVFMQAARVGRADYELVAEAEALVSDAIRSTLSTGPKISSL